MYVVLYIQGFVFFFLLVFLRVHLSFSITALTPDGVVAAVTVAPVFGAVKITAAIGVVKKEKWSASYKIGHGKLREIIPSEKDKKSEKKTEKKSGFIKNGLSFYAVENAVYSLELESASISVTLGMEDAAKCAMSCGAIQIALEELLPIITNDWDLKITPSFNSKIIRLDFTGMLIVKSENIMKSASLILMKALKEKLNEKKNNAKDRKNEEGNKNVISTSN